MIPSQLIRSLRQACAIAGLPAPEPDDDAGHDEAIDLLSELLDAVDLDRPGAAQREPTPSRGGWSRADPERVRALAAANRTDPQIAAELGTHPDAVRSLRRRHGIPAGGRGGGQPTGRDEQIREAHERGLDAAQIATEIGSTRTAVYQALYRMGLTRHPAEKRRRVIEAYARGLDAAQIAAELECSRGSVYEILRRLGLTPNPP